MGKMVGLTGALLLAVCAGASEKQAVRTGVGQDGWLDYNKNGVRDVFEDRTQPVDARIGNLLGQMSVREKAGQLSQLVFFHKELDKKILERVCRGEVGSLIHGCGNAETRNAYQREQVEKSRLGIPLVFGMDVIHGESMAFPSSIGLACSFEPDLFEQCQAVAAETARLGGIDWVFAPMCDLARDVRWGRVVETCGEDPYLAGLCCAAQVRGFQGRDNDLANPKHVAACLKHYVGYSAVTGGRDYNESPFSEWELRNGHLPPFQAAVRAGAATVMSSFNSIYGIPAAACRHTLTDVLRDEWGFGGFVVSDWNAVGELVNWGFAADKADAAQLALNAGNDMDMKSESFVPNMEQLVKDGKVTMETLDRAVRRVLKVKFDLGLFEKPYCDAHLYQAAYQRLGREKTALARDAARKSMVLLKNEGGFLPFTAEKGRRLALIGPFGAARYEAQGAWSCHTGRRECVKVIDGLKAQLPEGVELEYAIGCGTMLDFTRKTLPDGKWVWDRSRGRVDDDFNLPAALEVAEKADVIVMAIGEPRFRTGENQSRCELGLMGHQQEVFDAVAKLGKPIVSLVFSGRPLVIPEVWEKSKAVLYVWQPGCECGNAIADLFYGKVSPSGRLSISVPRGLGWVPAYYNRPTTGRPGASAGYTDAPDQQHAKYPFGFGLSYASFSYSKPRIEPAADGKPMELVCEIRNVGAMEAIETPQLYVRQVTCHAGWRPQRELRGFRRVSLKRGESAEVRFPIVAETLGYVGRDGKNVTDPGRYRLWIGKDSNNGFSVEIDWK